MTAGLSTGAPRLRKLVLLLSSDHDGEVVAAARAIGRLLEDAGSDWHALAGVIAGNGAHAHLLPPGDWRDDLDICAEHFDQLTPHEQNFVGNLRSSARWREPSVRQVAWLAAIAGRLRRAAA